MSTGVNFTAAAPKLAFTRTDSLTLQQIGEKGVENSEHWIFKQCAADVMCLTDRWRKIVAIGRLEANSVCACVAVITWYRNCSLIG